MHCCQYRVQREYALKIRESRSTYRGKMKMKVLFTTLAVASIFTLVESFPADLKYSWNWTQKADVQMCYVWDLTNVEHHVIYCVDYNSNPQCANYTTTGITNISGDWWRVRLYNGRAHQCVYVSDSNPVVGGVPGGCADSPPPLNLTEVWTKGDCGMNAQRLRGNKYDFAS
eukprot:gb/GECG01010955.1/.p1 GENE.gb/GECG01010955.1/~~gb/GECG01010955.1/.p1  ORF type:complete len:171 (+),score=7.20 gb/GECG01010955.1/:1-513(+)